jgi:WD40 repeat protein
MSAAHQDRSLEKKSGDTTMSIYPAIELKENRYVGVRYRSVMGCFAAHIFRGCLLLALAVLVLHADEPNLVIDSGGHQDPPKFLAFTRDGKYLVSGGDDKTVRVWDVASGKTVRRILGQTGSGPEGYIYAGALSPDEHYLAIAGWFTSPLDASDGVVRIHDFHTGEVVELLAGYPDVVTALAFSADGRWLASGDSKGELKIWSTAGWKLARKISAHQDQVRSVSISPDAATLVK